MAYCTNAQVAVECKLGSTGFTTGTTPTAAQVDVVISQIEAKVNAKLANRYAVIPVVDAGDVLVVQGICLAIIAERVRGIMGVVTGQKNVEQDRRTSNSAQAEKDLNDIVDGKVKLNTALISTSDGIRSYDRENSSVPVFKRGTDQW